MTLGAAGARAVCAALHASRRANRAIKLENVDLPLRGAPFDASKPAGVYTLDTDLQPTGWSREPRPCGWRRRGPARASRSSSSTRTPATTSRRTPCSAAGMRSNPSSREYGGTGGAVTGPIVKSRKAVP